MRPRRQSATEPPARPRTGHIFRKKCGQNFRNRQEFLAAAGQYKKEHERLGAHVRMWVPLAGGQPSTVLYVIEHADIATYGAFMKKLTTDTDYQKLVKATQDQQRVNPIAEMTASAILSEPWLPS